MNQNLKISTWEAISTIACVSLVPTLLTLPTYSAQTFGTAMLWQNIYIAIISFIILFLILSLYKNFTNMDIIDVSSFVGGRILKIIFGTLIIIYLLSICILTYAEFVENIQVILFNNAPKLYLIFLFAIAISIGTLKGLKSILKTSTLLAPLILLGYVFIFFTLFKNVDCENFFPILGLNSTNFFLQGFVRAAKYEGIFLLLLVVPYIKNIKKVGYITLTVDVILTLSFTFLLCGIIPFPAIRENYFPVFEITRLVSIGRFIQRIESIFMIFWLLISFVYLAMLPTLIISTTQKVFNINSSKKLMTIILPFIILACIIVNYFGDVLELRKFIFRNISSIICYAIPILLLLIATIKRRWLCKKDI